MNPFENKRIRSCKVSASGNYMFSVLDIIAVLTDSDYQKARNYWKWLKNKINSGQPVSESKQIHMEAQDGKLRLTDVMDAEGVLRLIQLCPSPKAEVFREWAAKLAKKGTNAAKQLTKAVTKVKYRVGSLLFIINKAF